MDDAQLGRLQRVELQDGISVVTYAPPRGFDPLAARPEEVQRYGFPPLPDNREHLKRYRRVFNQWYYCASWIGLDGDGSGDVFQAGVECEVYRSGSSITRVNIRDVDGILITPTIIQCRYVGPIP